MNVLKSFKRSSVTSGVILTFVVLALGLTSCSRSYNSEYSITGTLPVVSSIAQFIVNGTTISVNSVLTGTEDPHTYDLKPKDALILKNSNMILFVGEVDSWVNRFTKGKNSISIQMFEKNPIEGNPHIWFDMNAVSSFADALAKNLSAEFPDQKLIFEANLKHFNEELNALRTDYNLSGLKVVEILPTFDYLLREYHITNGMDLSQPEQQPTFSDITNFVNYVKENNVSCIVSNQLLSDKYSITISKDTNAKIVTLAPFVENEQNVSNIISLYRYDLSQLESCRK